MGLSVSLLFLDAIEFISHAHVAFEAGPLYTRKSALAVACFLSRLQGTWALVLLCMQQTRRPGEEVVIQRSCD